MQMSCNSWLLHLPFISFCLAGDCLLTTQVLHNTFLSSCLVWCDRLETKYSVDSKLTVHISSIIIVGHFYNNTSHRQSRAHLFTRSTQTYTLTISKIMWKNNDEKSEVTKCNIMDLWLIVGMCVKVVLSLLTKHLFSFLLFMNRRLCAAAVSYGQWLLVDYI